MIIAPCHWDGYKDNKNKCSLVEGAKIAYSLQKNNHSLKIYAGNKYSINYSDFKNKKIQFLYSLKELMCSEPYKTVLEMKFKTIVIVGFIIFENNDDYWRINGPHKQEYEQFKFLAEYLSQTYPNTEFIISNWESDCVLESVDNKELCANNIAKLISVRYKAAQPFKNVKIALEVNRFYNNGFCSTNYIIPKTDYDMISYSCYQTLWQSSEMLEKGIKYIRNFLKPGTELYIGEFGFPTNKWEEKKVMSFLHNSVDTFKKNNIRLAFYWNMYNNERNKDLTFNGFGLIGIDGRKTYVCKTLFPQSTIIMVRHGYSLSNKWKDINKKNHIDTKTANLYNLYDSELSYEGIKTIINNRNFFWNNILKISNERPIRVFVSPLKRSIQTCLLSLNDKVKNIKVTITPFITEKGNSRENYGMRLESIKEYPFLREYMEKGLEVEFLHFDVKQSWWKIPVKDRITYFFKYMKQRRYEWNCIECIVCFSHWGFIKEITNGIQLNNFGVSRYCTINSISPYTTSGWS